MFDVLTGPVPTIYRALTERKVELVFTRTVESRLEENMVVENLFDDDFIVVTAKRNPWTRRRRIELAELVNEPWILTASDGATGAFAVEAFRAHGLKLPRAAVIATSMHLRNGLLATGRFLSIMSSFVLMLPGKHPWLKALPVELPNARGSIAIVTLKNRTLSPLAELFIKTARAVAKPPIKK